MQFIPIVERTTEACLPLANLGWGERPGSDRLLYTQHGGFVTERSVGAEQFGRFLIAIFDEWVRRDVGNVFVQTFDVALGSWLGQHSLCIFSPTCGNALALEHNGDLYSCDHYVEPEYRLGNIRETPMVDLISSEQQIAFGQQKLRSLPKYCRECEVLFACHGECPRNRFITTPDGKPGLNYLCAGYKLFFNHIRPGDEDYGRPASPGPICRRNHPVVPAQGSMNGKSERVELPPVLARPPLSAEVPHHRAPFFRRRDDCRIHWGNWNRDQSCLPGPACASQPSAGQKADERGQHVSGHAGM